MYDLLMALGKSEDRSTQRDLVDLILFMCKAEPLSSAPVLTAIFDTEHGPDLWQHFLPHLSDSTWEDNTATHTLMHDMAVKNGLGP
jgi:hypothetical protein